MCALCVIQSLRVWEGTAMPLREEFLRAIANNPQFQEAEKSGKAFVIGGAKPYSEAEREIIASLRNAFGRSPTQEEINLSLQQARAIYGEDLLG
jgi:hypothetical protein